MSRPRVIHVSSIASLRGMAAAWDELWRRSDVTLPTLRAELLAGWVEQFAPQSDFHALVVEDQGQPVAALPLVRQRLGRLVDVGAMLTNEWSSRGELLLDPTADVDGVLDCLLAAMDELPWHLLWLRDVLLDAPYWKALHAALDRAGMAVELREQFRVGRIEIDHDWEACKSRWSRGHRQEMSRHARRLAAAGDVQLKIRGALEGEEVESWLRRGFQVEDRSWKGPAGTSVLKTPGIFDFYRRQAEQLARWGQLELHFLELDGHPIAFAYGISAKGVFHSCKIGYDAQFAAFSPGQLLRYNTLERFHREPHRRAIDCMGVISDAHRRWKPATYGVGRMVVAPRRLLGRMAMHAYKHWWPQVQRFRKGKPAQQESQDAASP